MTDSSEGFDSDEGTSQMSPTTLPPPARKVKKMRLRGPKQPFRGWPDAAPQQPSELWLFRLPPEIRNMIYEYVLAIKPSLKGGISTKNYGTLYSASYDKSITTYKNSIQVRPGSGWRQPGLLEMCRQSRDEALPMYYGINAFKLVTKVSDLPGIYEWLCAMAERLANIPGRKSPFGAFGIQVLEFPTRDIPYLSTLAHIVMEHPGVDILYFGRQCGEVIESVQALAREGREEGGASEWLDIKFEEWLAKEAEDNRSLRSILRKDERDRPWKVNLQKKRFWKFPKERPVRANSIYEEDGRDPIYTSTRYRWLSSFWRPMLPMEKDKKFQEDMKEFRKEKAAWKEQRRELPQATWNDKQWDDSVTSMRQKFVEPKVGDWYGTVEEDATDTPFRAGIRWPPPSDRVLRSHKRVGAESSQS